MSYTAAISLTLGNSYRYDTQVVRLRASLGLLPSVNRVVMTFPAEVELHASVGDDASVDLLVDEDSTTVLTGLVYEIGDAMGACSVTICDGSAQLCAARPMKTFEATSVGDVINGLAGEASVDTGAIAADLEMPVCIIDQNNTAAGHIARLAQLSDCLAFIDADNCLQASAVPQQADTALRYGRELLEYRVARRAAARPEIVAIGSGPAGSAQAPDALRPTVASLPADASEPSAAVQWNAYGALRTPKAVATAAKALNGIRNRCTEKITASCILCPWIRPGSVIEVSEAPDRLSAGPWIVTDVIHDAAGPSGTFTWWYGVGLGDDPGGLGF